MKVEIPFGAWFPDAADYRNPGLVEARNVYPSSAGYSPFPGLIGAGDTVSGTVLGARRFDRTDTTSVIVVGTTIDLYVIAGGTVTASGLSLSLAVGDMWAFEQFGKYVFATSKATGTYYLSDLDTDTSFSSAPGSPPKADTITRIGDFLVMGNMTDIDASDQVYRVRWSRFNSPIGTWGTDIAYQSGYVDMPSRYGEITGMSGGTVGMVFQKYAVSRFQYVGGVSAFRKEIIDEERGCASPRSVVQVGPFTYWVGFEGFCRSDGSSVENISSPRVWQWFRDAANMGYISRVQGGVDWPRRCVIWAFYGVDGSSYSQVIIYNWEQDRWSNAVIDIDCLVETTLEGLTLEEVAVIYPDIDAMSPSLDSPEFTAKGRTLSALVGGELSNFTGPALEATMETGDFQVETSRRSFVSEVWPIVENQDANARISIGTRAKPGASVMFSDDVSEGALGFAPVTADGRFFRVRMKIPAAANWGKASGLQVEAIGSGAG